MKNFKNLAYRHRLLLSIPIIALAIYLGGTVVSSSKHPKTGIVRVNNRTQSCEVVSAEKHREHIKVVLRNKSEKSITAFVISSAISPGTVLKFKEEFAYSENNSAIAPNSVYEKILAIPSSLYGEASVSLEFLAAVLDDKTSEGDLEVVGEIEDERLGEKVQIARIMPLLDKMLVLSDSEILIYFNENFERDLGIALNSAEEDLLVQFKRERGQIIDQQGRDQLPEQVKEGLHTGKESLLHKVRELDDLQRAESGNGFRKRVIRIRQVYERIATTL